MDSRNSGMKKFECHEKSFTDFFKELFQHMFIFWIILLKNIRVWLFQCLFILEVLY